jgi:hypothetical protein
MKCKYADKDTGECYCKKYYTDKEGEQHCIMHPYTTDMCNMKKPKLKLVRIKAWTHRFEDGSMEYSSTGLFRDHFTIPCTILIDKKYLKGSK